LAWPFRLTGPPVSAMSAWDPAAAYTPGDVVTYQGDRYRALAARSGLQNLIPNPSAEVNTTGWTAQTTAGGSMTRDTAQHKDGVASFKMTQGSTNGTMGGLISIPVKAGKPYSASAQLRLGVAGRAGYLFMSWYDAGGTRIGFPLSQLAALTLNSWVQIKFENQVAPAGAVRLDFQVQFQTPVANETPQNFDSVIVVQGATVPAYFDGSTPGWSWAGAAGNSVSQAPAPPQDVQGWAAVPSSGPRTLTQVEQDTLPDVQQSVYAYLSCPKGARPLNPDWGVEDPTFSTTIDGEALAAELEASEDGRALVNVIVNGPSGEGRAVLDVFVDLPE